MLSGLYRESVWLYVFRDTYIRHNAIYFKRNNGLDIAVFNNERGYLATIFILGSEHKFIVFRIQEFVIFRR